MIRRHEMLWLLMVLCLAVVCVPAVVLLPGSWWVVPICAAASYALSCVVLRLVP